MQNYLIFSFVLCLFTQLNTIQITIDEPTYFSGVIEYDIEFEVFDSTHEYIQYYKQAYGNKMKITIAKNGDFAKEYIGIGDYGREYIIYNQSENKFYGKSRSNDSVTCFRGDGIDILTLESEKAGEPEIILDQTCQALHLIGFSEWEDFSPKEDSESLYWFTENYKINKVAHKGINDVFWQRFLEVSQGAYYLKYIMKTPSYQRMFTATNVKPKEIDSIDSKSYLKDLPILHVD